MWKNYLKVAIRKVMREKYFSVINGTRLMRETIHLASAES